MEEKESKDKPESGEAAATVAEQAKGIVDLAPKRFAFGAVTKDVNVHAGHRARMRKSAMRDPELEAMSDIELVELLLSFVIPQKDTNVLAHKLLDRFGSVTGVMCARAEELVTMSGITLHVATMLPLMFGLVQSTGGKIIRLRDRAQIADFFGLANMGSLNDGTYAMFLDRQMNVRGIECFSGAVPMREILGSACKHGCKYVFVARREPDLFPDMFNVAREVGELGQMLGDMSVKMLDYIIFSDYGYYTVGPAPAASGWYPLYIFVPAVKYIQSQDLFSAITSGEVYAGRETAELPDDFALQLCAAVKGGAGD